MLVVDLDGTLLKSDMLHESFWSAFGKNWRSPLLAALALRKGRAALKEYLGAEASIDVSILPYDDEVLAYIRAHRKNGGQVALVTASNQQLAERVANHLDLFDEVYGSNGVTNLKGRQKADFLVETFGRNGFTYIGDASADLAVWRVSRKTVTANAPASLRQKAEALGKPVEHISTPNTSMGPYFKAIRAHQWLKNLLIFLPILAAHQFDSETLLRSILAFIAFSLVASCVYIFNDFLDLSADRAHPRKRFRPFASGVVPIGHGSALALVLLAAGVFVAALLGWAFLVTLGAYFILTTTYSLALKRRIVIDICVLAGLYTMRIIAGGVATNTALSVWLLAFSIFFFLSLAAVKRQAELVDMVERGTLKATGRGYHVEDLPIMSMIGLASGYISVLVMALYVNSPAVQLLYTYPHALWGICCVLLYWLTRLVLITHRGAMHDDPVVFAARDQVSRVCVMVMFGFGVAGAVL